MLINMYVHTSCIHGHIIYMHTHAHAHKDTDIHIDTRIQYFIAIGCLIFVGHFLQKSVMISGSFTERDVQLKASYASRSTVL